MIEQFSERERERERGAVLKGIPLIGLETRLDRLRWVAILGTTLLLGTWEAATRIFLPQLGWVGVTVTMGITFLLANAASIFVIRVIQTLQRQLEQRNRELQELNIQIITTLATTVEIMDPYTAGHSERISELTIRLGKWIGLSPSETEDLRIASLLHDIGKIGVPYAILQKSEPLTPEEWEKIKAHPARSAEIVKKLKPLANVVPIVLHHQERYDGSGYPAGLNDGQIPLGARILALADAYDAITSARPYRGARSPEEAMGELRRFSGSQFDPRLVESFLEMLSLEKASLAAG